jgi:polyhydroxyalkanoate synthesis regulator phasin
MTKDEAKKYVKDILAQKARWGRMALAPMSGRESDKLLEALEHILEDDAPTVPKEEHTMVQRQLTAAKAREAKMKKEIESLRRGLK